MYLHINLIVIFLCTYYRSTLKSKGILALTTENERHIEKNKFKVMTLKIVKEVILKGMF